VGLVRFLREHFIGRLIREKMLIMHLRVLGYDVNPLAISVSRAELIIAYYRRTGKEPNNPLLISR